MKNNKPPSGSTIYFDFQVVLWHTGLVVQRRRCKLETDKSVRIDEETYMRLWNSKYMTGRTIKAIIKLAVDKFLRGKKNV